MSTSSVSSTAMPTPPRSSSARNSSRRSTQRRGNQARKRARNLKQWQQKVFGRRMTKQSPERMTKQSPERNCRRWLHVKNFHWHRLDTLPRFLLKMRSTRSDNEENGFSGKSNSKGKLKMVKRITTSIRTHLPSVALFLILLFVLIQVMPRALGQSSDRGSDEALAIHQQEEIGVDRSTPPATTSRRTSQVRIPAAPSDSQSEAAERRTTSFRSAGPGCARGRKLRCGTGHRDSRRRND